MAGRPFGSDGYPAGVDLLRCQRSGNRLRAVPHCSHLTGRGALPAVLFNAGLTVSPYKYTPGQQVRFVDRRVLAPGPASEFVVIKPLPSGGEAPRYEVQGSRERFTRVAEEATLQAIL